MGGRPGSRSHRSHAPERQGPIPEFAPETLKLSFGGYFAQALGTVLPGLLVTWGLVAWQTRGRWAVPEGDATRAAAPERRGDDQTPRSIAGRRRRVFRSLQRSWWCSCSCHARVGVPVTLATLAICAASLWWRAQVA